MRTVEGRITFYVEPENGDLFKFGQVVTVVYGNELIPCRVIRIDTSEYRTTIRLIAINTPLWIKIPELRLAEEER